MANLTDKDREELVAYLDGELDEQRAHDVEAKIAVDERFRAEAHALKQTWELLDHLPRAEPSGNFTHQTLERLALGRGASTSIMPAGRRRAVVLGLGWAAAAAVAAVVSFWAAGSLPRAETLPTVDNRPSAEETLERHLRLIRNAPLYEEAGDFEMLQALDDPNLFGDDDGP
jgi:anti-sigma factor RsiW